jgi:hypothetical protein
MNIPIPHFRPTPIPDNPPAMVRVMGREDVLWNRPIFKAPPLELNPLINPLQLAEDLRRIALGDR